MALPRKKEMREKIQIKWLSKRGNKNERSLLSTMAKKKKKNFRWSSIFFYSSLIIKRKRPNKGQGMVAVAGQAEFHHSTDLKKKQTKRRDGYANGVVVFDGNHVTVIRWSL